MLPRELADHQVLILANRLPVSGERDAAGNLVLQKAGGGAPTINLVVPVRFTHAHNGIVNRRDFDQTVDLVVALLQRLDTATVSHLRDF